MTAPAGGRRDDRAAPARGRSAALVAVLRKRGRFLVAEPLFSDGPDDGSRAERAGAPRVTIAPARAAPGGSGASAGVGDLVLVRTSTRRGGGWFVARVLGRPDTARDVIEGLLLARGASRGFDAQIQARAQAARDSVRSGLDAEVRAGSRRDLREVATFTIDPSGAKDFDDAVSAELLKDGGVRLRVHIADVAAHVREGSELDREARRRATSVYVPGTVEPMLPPSLSDDACSLIAGTERATVTVELDLRDGDVRRRAFYRSLIRSDARLDYERVDRVFAGDERAADPWGRPLALARTVAAELARKRAQAGALLVDSEEPEFELDQRGHVRAIHTRAQTESHRLIEHLMIAANEAVAGLLAQRRVPCLYRVHERPNPERIERLIAQLASLDVPTPPLPEPLSSSQAAELVGAISQRVDAHVRATGQGRLALASLLLRSLKQAYYSPSNLGHAGLRSPCYCHFTSPIRRYPDIVCHRALLFALGAGEQAPRASSLAQLGAWSSERERDAMLTERDADDIARCFALERVLREQGSEHVFGGEVIGLIGAGAFVAFGDGNARTYEGLLPARQIPAPGAPGASSRRRRAGRGDAAGPRRVTEQAREWWQLNEQGTILCGQRSGANVRLGDAVAVAVAQVDPIRGRADLLAPAPPPG
jgi:ribonuclease R